MQMIINSLGLNSRKLKLSAICLIFLSVTCLYPFKGTADENEQNVITRHRQVRTHATPYDIHNDQLRETMFRLNALVSYSPEPVIPLDNDSTEFLQQLIDTVRVIVKSAESLKKKTQINHLGAEQIEKYSALADKLYEEALAIDDSAKKNDAEEMNRAFLNLNQTCIACHTLFRGL
ncbi:MAG: hypothetical protein ACI909_003371 [Planctomycetota bacterium]|jgi:hypothetical protein